MAKVDLSVEIAGVKFKNPIGASSGQITKSAAQMRKIVESGAGSITIKSICNNPETWKPMSVNADMFFDKYGARGCYMPGGFGVEFLHPDVGVAVIKEAAPFCKEAGCVLIASVHTFPEFIDKDIELAKRLEDAGADMLEVLTACPALAGYADASYIAISRQGITECTPRIKKALSIPVICKYRFHDVYFGREMAIEAEATGVDALHNGGHIPGTLVNIETGRPFMSLLTSSMKGPYCKYWGNAQMGITATTLKSPLPLCSSAGMWTGRDVIERLMCGATIAEIHTAIAYRGYKLFTKMKEELENFLERKGYSSVKEIIGMATPYLQNADDHFNNRLKTFATKDTPLEDYVSWGNSKESVEVLIDKEKCNGCGICSICTFLAMTMDDGFPKVNYDLCERCGTCASICPQEAIKLRAKV